jgi:signal transduction histidine kinase
VVCDRRGGITMVNEGAKRLAQMDPEGKTLKMAPSIWGEMFDPNGHRIPAVEWPCTRALAGKVTLGRECHMVRSDKSSYDILFSASPIKNTYGRTVGSIATLTDITEHKRKELALREQMVLKERGRIAAEMHDTVVQSLNAIVVQLEAAEEEFLEDPEHARQRLRRVREVARESLADTRRSMWTLSDESFENEDPAVALAFLAQKLFGGTPVQLQLHLEQAACRLTPEMGLGLLRIGKEALVNVWKHAHATKVRVELSYGKQDVRLSVLDHGQGFLSVPLSSNQRGFGLFGFQTRAKNLGGKVVVHSRPKRGTQVVVTIPLHLPCLRRSA